MNRIYILIGGLVILAIGVAVYLFSPSSSVPGSAAATSTNPFGQPSGTIPVTTIPVGAVVPTATPGSLNLVLRDGTSASVPDFTKVNQPPNANATNGFQVAGSDASDFDILYYPQNSGILVALFSEPLGAVRLAAEDALRATLGLPDSQLCKLTISVGTTIDVNATYAGMNLGLSFCLGATVLPK